MQTTLTHAETLRYSRHILLDGWDIEAQVKLKQAHIILIGLGGLGCPFAETLTRGGLGKLTLIDHDTVDMSNLQRQTLYDAGHIGSLKVRAASKRLSDISPFIHITSHAVKFEDYILLANHNDKPSLVVDCSDNFATRDQINQWCIQHNLPLLSAAAIGFEGQVALYTSPSKTGCYHCVFDNHPTESTTSCAESGVLNSNTMLVGSMAAQQALLWLGTGQAPLANRLWAYHGLTGASHSLAVTQSSSCSSCCPL